MIHYRKKSKLSKTDLYICLKFYHIFAIFTIQFRQYFPWLAYDTPYRFLTLHKWYWLIVWKYKSVPAGWFFPLPYASRSRLALLDFLVCLLRIAAPSESQGNKWLSAIVCYLAWWLNLSPYRWMINEVVQSLRTVPVYWHCRNAWYHQSLQES